jgi:hypothetical protein
MIQGKQFFDKESLVVKKDISNSRVFTLGQIRQLFNLEVVGARA